MYSWSASNYVTYFLSNNKVVWFFYNHLSYLYLFPFFAFGNPTFLKGYWTKVVLFITCLFILDCRMFNTSISFVLYIIKCCISFLMYFTSVCFATIEK